MANPAKDLFRHSAAFHPLLYAGGRNEHFAEKQPDAPSRWHSRASVSSHRVVPGAGVPSSLKLRRDKAIGVTRQRNRKAGGTPGGVSPCKKAQNKLSPHIGNIAFQKGFFPTKQFCNSPLIFIIQKL
ncbi:MAG: hypothetical protein IKB71_00955 [Lentisphaeria bacterium]|nr:hypothetical protein [Lentisphaeria bacterium]